MAPPHHHSRGPHAYCWFYNREGPLDAIQLGELYRRIADGLVKDGPLQLTAVAVPVPVPETVHAVVCHERAPGGELMLKLELIWGDEFTLDALPHVHRGPHPDRRMYRSEGELTRGQVAALLRSLATGLTNLGAVALGDLTLPLPALVQGVVRYERPPRGELVLRIEITWLDGSSARANAPITELIG